MIDTSIPGNRHFWRCKAAYLLGGYVAGGLLTADEVSAALEVAVQRNTTKFPQAMKTIQACLVAGMQAAIRLEELERQRRQWLAANRRRLVAADPWLAGHAHGIPLTVRREVYDG